MVAICWDIALTDRYVPVSGTFRLESEFDTFSYDTAYVSIITSDYKGLPERLPRTSDPGYSQIETMVKKAVEIQGELQNIIQKGDQVMLKVNLVGANSPSGQGENTDVRVVKALMKKIQEITAGDVEIWVAEGTARVNDDPASMNSVWHNSGYTDLLTDPEMDGINFTLVNLNQSYNDLIEVDLGKKSTAAVHDGKYYIHKAEKEADVYISVPVLKIHNTGITCALKNQIGTAPGAYYGYNKQAGSQFNKGLIHISGQRVWRTEEIVDFSTIADIDYVLVDAIMCLESSKAYNGSNQVRFNTVIAGTDPVAVDHICAKLFCLNPDDIDHITLAEKTGLGTSNPALIKVKGSTINETRIKMKKDISPEGSFGQSNRNWILSQAFQGTDIHQDYLTGESSFIPSAGLNGWSQPVYFFDDRIDLLSYYQDPADVITYAYTFFYSPLDQPAELWLGYDESILVYLNGKQVYSFEGQTTFEDSELVKVKPIIYVRKGENTLLVKTCQQYGDYSFTLNICEIDSNINYAGNRLPGLKFYTNSTVAETALPEIKSQGENDLKVYPNPMVTQAILSFTLYEAGETTLKVYDIEGKLVLKLLDAFISMGYHSCIIDRNRKDMAMLKPGLYICVLKSLQTSQSIKLIIQ